MTRKIVHIGSKKCASTWLQEEIFPRLQHVQYLRDRAYWRDQLYWPSRDIPWPESDKPILVSDENLEGRLAFGNIEFGNQVRALHDNVDDLTILYLFREQRKRLASGYQESVRWGNPRTFPQWIAPDFTRLHRGDATVLAGLDHWQRYQILRDVCGKDGFVMVPMEGLFAPDATVMDRLDDVLGSDLSGLVQAHAGTRSNEAMGWGMLRTVRLVNRIVRSGGFTPTLREEQKGRRALIQKASVRFGTSNGRAKARQELLRQVDEHVPMQRFHEGNGLLAKALGIDLAALGYETGA